MLLAVYSALLTLAFVLTSPWWLWRMVTANRYRHGLAQRLGLVSPTLRATVLQAQAEHRPIIWLHAVSVGEVLASVRLVQELEQELKAALTPHLILISTTTLTGHTLAQERFGPHRVFYLPLDFAIPVRRYLHLLRPRALLLMESELWPRLLASCRRARIPVAVLNARISDRSYPRYLRLRPLWRCIFANVTLFLAQGEETATRLRAIGALLTQIQITGNLKYDGAGEGYNAMTKRIGALLFESRLLVAGSTLEGEEQLLFDAWPQIVGEVPDVALLIAPRHPERFDEVYALMSSKRFAVFRCSSLLSATEPIFRGTMLLLDSLGDLASIYGIASAAFVGGSLVPKGGHNPLEATRFGVPVVMGKSFENFREVVQGLVSQGAVEIVRKEDLATALIEALNRPSTRPRFFQGQTGATRRTIAALLPLIQRDTGAPQ